jgi:hypothetical protein
MNNSKLLQQMNTPLWSIGLSPEYYTQIAKRRLRGAGAEFHDKMNHDYFNDFDKCLHPVCGYIKKAIEELGLEDDTTGKAGQA